MNNEKALNWLYNNHPDFSWDMVDFSIEARMGVYCIYNATSGQAYFGKSGNIKQRITIHKSSFLIGKGSNPFLQSAFLCGNDLRYFVVRYVDFNDTAALLEAHWACVFGGYRCLNMANVFSQSFESGECFNVSASLGHTHRFVGFDVTKGDAYDCCKPPIESARKLII